MSETPRVQAMMDDCDAARQPMTTIERGMACLDLARQLERDLEAAESERIEWVRRAERAEELLAHAEEARKEAVALAARLRDIMQADRDAMKVIEADAEECKQ